LQLENLPFSPKKKHVSSIYVVGYTYYIISLHNFGFPSTQKSKNGIIYSSSWLVDAHFGVDENLQST
jgi:hypothetical protein